jgi:hypothetical protein
MITGLRNMVIQPRRGVMLFRVNHAICFDTVSESRTVNTPPSGFGRPLRSSSIILSSLRDCKLRNIS